MDTQEPKREKYDLIYNKRNDFNKIKKKQE